MFEPPRENRCLLLMQFLDIRRLQSPPDLGIAPECPCAGARRIDQNAVEPAADVMGAVPVPGLARAN